MKGLKVIMMVVGLIALMPVFASNVVAATKTWTTADDWGQGSHNNVRIEPPDATGATDAGLVIGLPVSLVGLWHLDESSGTSILDSTSYANNGSISAGVTRVTGKNGTGGALQFDGTNYAQIPDTNNSLDFGTGDFTLALWVKTTQNLAGNKVYLGRVSGTMKIWLGGVDVGGVGKARISVRDSAGVAPSTAKTGSITINDGGWHHLVGVKRGNTMELYVDGIFEYSESATFTGNFNFTESYTLANFGSGYYAAATIDEVRIYTVALSPTAIAGLAAQ